MFQKALEDLRRLESSVQYYPPGKKGRKQFRRFHRDQRCLSKLLAIERRGRNADILAGMLGRILAS